MAEQLYRYDDVLYAGLYDEGYGRSSGRLAVELSTFDIVKRTKCGVWIVDSRGRDRFVNLEARKKYACESKESARDSFIARKSAQLRIYAARAERAQDALHMAGAI